MDKLKLQVLLDMADRVSAPLKRIGSGARTLGRDLDEAQKALRGLERQQAAVAKYRGMQEGLRDTKARLDAARTSQQALVAELKKGGDAAKAVGPQYRAANDAVNKLTQAYGRQIDQTRRMRQGLAGMGITNAAADEKRLAEAVDRTTKAMERKRAAQARLERMEASAKKGAAMGAGMAAGGAAAMYAGQKALQPVKVVANAYAQQETASTQLKASMMVADGSVLPEFEAINALAQKLGDRLPGTTADFLNMMTTLRREGMSAQAVLGGTGEAAAYLGVQLQIPVTAAASFAAKMQDATRATESEMMDIMDTIQRTYYLGVDHQQMLSGFSKMGSVLEKLRVKGADAATSLSPLLVMMNQSGMEDGGSAGNAIRKVIDAGLDAKKLDKTNAILDSENAGFNLNFTDADGNYAGLEHLFGQLEKIKSIKSDITRTSVIKQLFGDDAETHQVLGVLMTQGMEGYQAIVQKMQAQADLQKRVKESLGTFSNVMEAAQGAGTNALASIGKAMESDLKGLVNWFGEVSTATNEWVQRNQGLVAVLGRIALVLAAVLTIGGAILIPLGLLLAKAALLRFVVARLGMSFGLFSTASRAASAGMGLLSRAGTLLAAGWRMALPYVFALGRGLMVMGRFLMATPLGLALSLLATAATMWYTRWNEIKGGAIALWTDLVALKDQFFQAGADLITGLANGVTSRLAALRDTVVGVAGEVAATFKETLGINSPSRVFMEYGGWISEGAAIGMQKGQHLAAAAAVGLAATTAAPMALAGGSALARPAGAAMAAPAAGSTYQITINAAQGMDGQAIAQAVRAEIERMEAAKRRRVNSQMSDME